MKDNLYARYPVEVEVAGGPGDYVIGDAPARITAMIFEKRGTRVRVSRLGVEMKDGHPDVLSEATRLVDSLNGAWGNSHQLLPQQGFTYLGREVVESLAPDFLADGCEHAGRAAASQALAKRGSTEERVERESAAFKEYRQAVILLAAAAEAFINEFISLNIPARAKELLGVRPVVAKWQLAVELATGLRIEDEAPLFGGLSTLFTLRNKLMHFSPRREVHWLSEDGSETKGLRRSLRTERRPMKHCAAVVDGAATLMRLGDEKPVYDLAGLVTQALKDSGAPPREISQLAILARPVRRIVRR